MRKNFKAGLILTQGFPRTVIMFCLNQFITANLNYGPNCIGKNRLIAK